MLPSVSPLTSSPKKRLQFTGGRSYKRVRPTVGWAALRSAQIRLGLRDPDEDALHRVVDPERLLDHVAVLVEGDGKTEQRRCDADVRLLDLRTNLRAGRRAVFAGPVDRARDDLRRHVARCTEELRALVDGLEGRDPLVRRIVGEERVVHDVPESSEQRIEEAVGAHQLGAGPALAFHLLAESLTLRRQLPREVDELGVPRDLVDQRREVRLLLTDAVTTDGYALGLELCLHLVGEAGAVGLLVVDDVDPLHLERGGDVARDALALRRVRRDGAEEEALPGA